MIHEMPASRIASPTRTSITSESEHPWSLVFPHSLGHTIIRAVVGDHENLVQFPEEYTASDYRSVRSPQSFMGCEFPNFSEGDDPAPFLNGLCIQVAGYVGEAVFGELDALPDMDGPGWHRVGRGELVEAYQLCEAYAATAGVAAYEVLEACMEVVDNTLCKYQHLADRMLQVLSIECLLDGYRFAALLAEIKEDDLSIQVRQRLGLPH